MAIATNAEKESLAIKYGQDAQFISLHTASPGTTGANEASGGSPAYARKALAWTPGASDGVNNAAQVTFDVPAGTYTHIGIWSAATGGTFLDSAAIGSSQFGSQGQILVTPTFTMT